MKRFLLSMALLLALCVPWTLAQTTTTTPPVANYKFETGVDATKWIDISTGSTTILSNTVNTGGDSKVSEVTSIGFTFGFGGSTYTQFSVNSDGNLRLGSLVTGTGNYYPPFNSTNANANNPKINAFGADGSIGQSGYVKYKVVGTAPNRILVVEYSIQKYASTASANDVCWQVQLYETSNEILFVYSPVAPATSSIPQNFQPGMCTNANDVLRVVTSTNTKATGAAATTNAQATWPAVNRYYRFYMPDCMPPANFKASNPTSSSVNLSWGVGKNETSWQYVYGSTGFTPDWSSATTVTTTSTTITGLTPNTPYDVYVRSYCSDDDQSDPVSASFRTLCEPVGYEELGTIDFEDYTTGSTTNGLKEKCWTIGNRKSSSTTYIPYVVSGASYAHGGSRSFKVHASYNINASSNADSAYAIMPPISFDESITNYMVKFYMRKGNTNSSSSNYNDTLYVGIMSDPTEFSTLQIVGYTVNTTTTYTQCKVAFTNYTGGTNGYVVFLSLANKNATTTYKYGSFYIDDVTVMHQPTCFEPSNLKATGINHEHATLSWTPSTHNETLWNLDYKASTDEEWTSVSGITTPYTLNGLTPNTTYQFRVQSECVTEQSDWTDPVTFKTYCEPRGPEEFGVISFESSEGFTGGTSYSAIRNCWNAGNLMSTSTNYIPYVYNQANCAHTGSNSLKIYAYSTIGDSAYAVMPPMVFGEGIANYQMKFYMRKSSVGTSNNDTLYVGIVTDPANMSSLQIVGYAVNTTADYHKYKVKFTSYTGGTEGFIVFLGTIDRNSTATTKYGTFYVDDIQVGPQAACEELLEMAVSDVQRRSITVNWNFADSVPANCTGYEAKISTSSNPTAEGDTTIVLNNRDTASCTFDHLERETAYYVHVRSICGASNYSEWMTASATTKGLIECSPIGDGTSTTSMPYSSYGSTYFQQIFTAEELLANGIVAGPITGITFTWNTTNSVSKNMTIWMGQTEKETFSSNTDWEPAATFTQHFYTSATTFTAGTTTYPFSTPFVWDGTSNIIIASAINNSNTSGFTSIGGNCGAVRSCYMYTDNYQYGINPTVTSQRSGGSTTTNRSNVSFCQIMEACPAVEDVASSDITTNSAVISWTQSTGDYANTNDVIVSDTAVTDFTAWTAPTHAAINGTTDTLTGLAQYTLYYVYVRANCNGESHDDGNSNWVEHIFRTEARCEYPRNVAAKTIAKNTIRIDWTNKQGETTAGNNYEYYYSKTMGEPTGAGTATTAGYAEITGLAYDSTYYCYVRKVCGGEDGESPWVMDSVKTHPYLPKVVNLTASNISHNALTITWNRNYAQFANETQWEYACTIFGSTHTVWTAATDSFVIVTGLDPTTQYRFTVRPTDGAGNYGEIVWIDASTTTIPEPCQEFIAGSTTVTQAPMYTNFQGAYSVVIYTAEELAAQGYEAGEITSISYYQTTCGNTTTATKYRKTTTVWMKNTTKSSFSSTSDWEGGMTEVMAATAVDFNKVNNWIVMNLDQPFTWDGTSNIAVAVLAYSSSYTTMKFRGGNNAANSATIVSYYDTDNWTVTDGVPSVTSKVATSADRPNIRFCFSPAARPAPNKLNVDQITTTTARATWYPGMYETAWQYCVSTVEMDTAALSAAEKTATTNVINALTGLTKDTDYHLYVRANYGDSAYSNWAHKAFTTLPTCSAPITAAAANTDDNEITFDATFGQYGTVGTYDFRYWRVGTTDTVTVAGQNSQIVATNVPGGDYDWEVRANCSGTDEGASRWVAGNTIRVCGAYALPYTQGFEDIPTTYSGPGMIETICWNDINAGATSSIYPNYKANTSYKTEGSKSLQFYSSNTTDIYVIMPELINAPDCRVTYDWGVENNEGSSGNLYVGYMTDITGDSTFVKCDSVISTSVPMIKTLYPHAAYLRNIPTGARITFCYGNAGSSNYYGYLDNIVVDTIPLYTLSSAVAPVSTYGNIELFCNAADTAADGRFYEGTTPSLKATAETGFYFTEWSNGLTADSITVRMMSDSLLTANFDTVTYNLTVVVDPAYASLGTVSGDGTFKYLSNAQISASPVEHYHVVWEDRNLDNPRTITMPAKDTTYTATFAIDTFIVTLIANPDSLGSVEGAGKYTWGQTATLRAVPNEHQEFLNWSNGERTEEIQVVITQDTTFTANYKTITHYITVLPNDTAMGTVTGEGEYNQGTDAILNATANEHYHFTGWSNGATTNQITFTVSQDSVMVATFAIDRHNISTAVNNPNLGSVTGAGEYNYGEQVTLTATAANSHVVFQGWSDGETAATRNVTVAGDATYTALFGMDTHTITGTSAGNGQVTGTTTVAHGTVVTLTATADDHYHFVNWSNGSLDATITVVADSDATYTAYFAIDRHVISTTVNNLALGSVTGAGEYDYNAQVTLTAVPAGNHVVFTGWNDGETALTRNVTVAGDATYTANFALDTHTITGTSAGNGQVTGSATVAHGTLVTLTATADAHYHFVNWSNGATTNVISILADRDSSVVANFAIDRHNVTANVNNIALGSVTGMGEYDYNASVTMTAIPADSHCRFTGWSNGATANPYTFNLTSDTALTATFALDTHTITGTSAGHGQVTGSATVAHGTVVTLTATADAHYHFVNWSNGATTNVISILADQDYTLVANFAIDQHVVTLNVNNNALGSVTGAGTYNYGAAATLVATPANAHCRFTGWNDGVASATRTINVTADITYTANFAVDQHTVAANVNDPTMGTVTGAGSYTHGDQVTLVATPAAHHHFINWSNGATTNVLNFIADQNYSLTANFGIDQYVITAVSSDETMGTVTGSGTYNYGAAVTLTATPAAHYHFIGWSNGETSNVITMSANADVNLVAYFEIDSYTVTAAIMGNGYVFGEGTFEYGTTVTLYAIPDPGWQFDGWSDGTASDTLTFVITGDVTYTATFSLIPTPPTGVEDVETFNYVAYSENLDIIINGVADHNVAVYDMAGRLVKMITNASAEERVNVHAAGVYVIRVDNFAATRVVVK